MLDSVILLLASASILAAVYWGQRAVRLRSQSAKATYGVAQQENRHAMRVDLVRGIMALFVGLILFSVVGLSPGPVAGEIQSTAAAPTAEPTLKTSTTTPALSTSKPTETTTAPVPTDTLPPAATATSPVVTPTPTELPSPTPSPEPVTATVNSEVGIWLRDVPGVEGEQLEWLLDGTRLTLLPGLESADELEWQQVVSPDGTEGWVAVPFISYSE